MRVVLPDRLQPTIRMMGTNQEEGKKILRDNGYNVFETLEESAEHAVKLATDTGGS